MQHYYIDFVALRRRKKNDPEIFLFFFIYKHWADAEESLFLSELFAAGGRGWDRVSLPDPGAWVCQIWT